MGISFNEKVCKIWTKPRVANGWRRMALAATLLPRSPA